MAGTSIGAKSGACAFKQGSAWGTAVAVDAGCGLKVLSYDENTEQEPLPNEELGAAAGSVPDVGNWKSSGPVLRGKCRYGAMRFLAYLFGTAETPTQTPPATGTTYLHDLVWADTLQKFATLCLGAGSGAVPHEFPSWKVNEIVLEFTEGGELRYEIHGIASSRARAGTNDGTSMAAATTPNGRRQIMGTHATFRMNSQSGGALASTTDDIKIRGWRLTLRRPMRAENETQSIIVAEPFEEGAVEVMFSVTLRSYEADTYLALWEDLNTPTPRKADIKFLSGYTPASGSAMYVQFDFPYVTVMQPPKTDVPGPGRIPHTIDFKCIKPISGSAPTGMTCTGPVEAFVLDERSTAYIA